jgi:hypothetical protein
MFNSIKQLDELTGSVHRVCPPRQSSYFEETAGTLTNGPETPSLIVRAAIP